MTDNRELIEQLRSVFFEEAEDGLAVMESGLLQLDEGVRDPELINSIFRAAHSIKGGSGTFGFDELIDFTHSIETLLDRMRDGQHPIDSETVSVLLRAVDQLRVLMVAAMDAQPTDPAQTQEILDDINALLGQEDEDEAPGKSESSKNGAGGGKKTYGVDFEPNPTMMRSGNDPVLILREVASLGTARVSADTSGLVDFENMDPEAFYLKFRVELETASSADRIEEVFAWVEDEAKVAVTELNPSAASKPAAPAAAPPKPQAETAPPKSPETPQATEVAVAKQPSKSPDSGSIRVSIEKIDALINLVGELVITQSMLGQIEKTFDMSKLDRLRDGLSELERNTRQLQESVMRIRMLPIRFVFSRFPRMVRDLGQKLDKQVRLTLSGEGTELDKTVMEKIGDPLVHLVRNALDHGIESPSVRREAGKNPEGSLELKAYHQGGSIVIEVRDDGRGLDEQKIFDRAVERGLVEAGDRPPAERILDLIFHPGFSTAEKISDISGRGVGLDVVRRNIRELGGHIEVTSKHGIGTTFTIRLPLTLAILDGQLVQIGRQTFIVPLVSIAETLEMEEELVSAVAGRAEVYRLRDEYIPIVRLYELFGIEGARTNLEGTLLTVIEGAGQRAGILVDDLLDQQQVVIKSLESNFRQVDGVSGATILGDGTVALILDTAGLINFATRRAFRSKGAAGGDEHLVWS